MGKAEKIIVLTVLLAISGILALSLNTGDGSARGPLSRAVAGAMPGPVLAAEPEKAPPAAALLAATLPRRDAPGAVDAASADGGRLAAAPEAAPAPEGSALLSLADLEPSGRPDYYFYTWRAGDTFTTVASRLYGDPAHKELLRRHNEGRLHVPVGDQIFVPAFAQGASPDPLAGEAGDQHTVQEGESLWTIARDVYGSGARWKDLFDANRDQLKDADQLKRGMVLRIP